MSKGEEVPGQTEDTAERAGHGSVLLKHKPENPMSLKQKAEANYQSALGAITKDIQLTGIDGAVLEGYGKKVFGTSFVGVFARDDDVQLRVGQCCVMNNESAAQGGEHWLGLAMCRDGRLLQYDSFGRKNFLHLPAGKSRDTEPDAEQVQSETNCGNRCLAFCAVFLWGGEDQAYYV